MRVSVTRKCYATVIRKRHMNEGLVDTLCEWSTTSRSWHRILSCVHMACKIQNARRGISLITVDCCQKNSCDLRPVFCISRLMFRLCLRYSLCFLSLVSCLSLVEASRFKTERNKEKEVGSWELNQGLRSACIRHKAQDFCLYVVI